MIEIPDLKQILNYDKESGIFTWKVDISRKVKCGDIAGSLHEATGYVIITYKNNKIRAHRLAWAFVNGKWPEKQIDHKNNDRSDNRYENLREATIQQNMFNRIIPSNNTSGIKGVYFIPKSNKWGASVWYNYQRFYLGSFDEIEEARQVVTEKRKELHGDFSNHGNISTKE